MTNREKYDALHEELLQLERKHGLYLSDPNIAYENCPHIKAGDENESDYRDLYWASVDFAGIHAEAAGYDINALLGRVLY